MDLGSFHILKDAEEAKRQLENLGCRHYYNFVIKRYAYEIKDGKFVFLIQI